MWSSRPNGRLLAEVADLAPGRALDVGCGEGVDAIWLAQRGWTVTAIDISTVAIGRAREAAARAGAEVQWVCADALQAIQATPMALEDPESARRREGRQYPGPAPTGKASAAQPAKTHRRRA